MNIENLNNYYMINDREEKLNTYFYHVLEEQQTFILILVFQGKLGKVPTYFTLFTIIYLSYKLQQFESRVLGKSQLGLF